MKRIFKILLVCMLLVPIAVSADMGAPYIKPIEAVITKKGGITAKDYSGKTKHFDENEVVLVTGVGDEISIITKSDNYYDVSSDDIMYIIPKTSEVKPGDEGVNKLQKQREFEVVLDEIKVYKGPSIVFPEVGTFKKGTQLTAFYEMETSEAFSEWFYIQEESLSGWIQIQGYNSYPVYEVNAKPLKVLFTSNVTLNGAEIKEKSIYKIYYWSNPYLTIGPVIKINNDFVDVTNEKVEIISDSKKVTGLFHMTQFNFSLKKDTKLYSDYKLSDEITIIPAGTKLSNINLLPDYVFGDENENFIIYVSYNNKLGWIKVNDKIVEEIEINNDELVSPYIDPEGDEGDDEEQTTELAVNDEPKKEKKSMDKNTIIIFVVVAVSAAVIALSSIVLLNKKNKKDTLKDIQEELDKTQSIDKVKEDK